jgi:hypothetical protein
MCVHASRARGLILLALASAYVPQVLAQEDLQEQFVQRMSKALIELPSNPHEFERGLVANGLAAQDADQTVQRLIKGFVRCLLDNLRAYSEAHGESFTDKLPHMLESLNENGAKPLLREMIVVSEARGPAGETCALNELQKAGISVDALD